MRRSMVIASAVVCALSTAGLAQGQSLGDLDRFGFEIRLGGRGGSFHTARELERAEARLRGARRAHQEGVWGLDALHARQQALAQNLAAVERRIAEARGSELELRRLHEQLDAAQRNATVIEDDAARFRGLAAEASRSADGARDAHFRRAEESSLIIDARRRVEAAEQELDRARQWALEQQLYPSFEWQSASGRREDVARRLGEAQSNSAPAYEIEPLRRELAEVEARLEEMTRHALLREPTVRAAESRLLDTQRMFDAAWAGVVRDLERDPDFRRARDDAARFEADAARAETTHYGVRQHIDRLHRDIERVHQAAYVVDMRELERRGAAIGYDLDLLAREIHAARQYLAQAQCELRDAQFAYDAAYAAHQRCVAEERHSISLRIEHRDPPRHDRGRGHGDDDRDEQRGGYERRRDERGRDDDRDEGVGRSAPDEDRARSSAGDDRRSGAGAASSGGGSNGTYRDRGERYERAREEAPGRQRTRD